jgi:hypothetical protein
VGGCGLNTDPSTGWFRGKDVLVLNFAKGFVAVGNVSPDLLFVST